MQVSVNTFIILNCWVDIDDYLRTPSLCYSRSIIIRLFEINLSTNKN